MSASLEDQVRANPHRFRLSRAGILNVWQYDDQVFEIADGRLLLRGANGAGKSKTLEMLLPFALDGDKLRITASGKHHTSLLWLMTDGYDGNRTGYVWVEFVRDTQDGRREVLTCGVGIRASSSAKAAVAWFFTCPRPVGSTLLLEDDGGPLPKDRCRAAVAPDGHFFEQARPYRQHVGRELFGLEPAQYDELLRLLYWLRQPQVGEDIEPTKLAEQLGQALPQVDDDAIRAAGDTFDELAAFGEQIDRRDRAATAIASFAGTYAAYARGVARDLGCQLVEAQREAHRRAGALRESDASVEQVAAEHLVADRERQACAVGVSTAQATMRELESSPEARSHQRLLEMDARADELAAAASRAEQTAERAGTQAGEAQARIRVDRDGLRRDVREFAADGAEQVATATRLGIGATMSVPPDVVSPELGEAADAALIAETLVKYAEAVAAMRPAVGEALAVVHVVDAARQEAEAAAQRRDTEERRLAEAERRAEEERGRREDAAGVARAAEAGFSAAVELWVADQRAVPVQLPELTAFTVPALAATARTAAAAELNRLRGEETTAAAARMQAETTVSSLRTRREAIETEGDPAPPEPPLGRSPREDTDGAPLWRLVDFTADLPQQDRAGLEAALEAAGLLDAWVRTDGAILDPQRRDVVLPIGPGPAQGRTLADVLVADVPACCGVSPTVVRRVLGRVALDTPADSDVTTVIRADGSWRLGPLVGRSAKPTAQYVGATARVAERARRLAEVDAQITQAESERVDAARREAEARQRRGDVEAWLAAAPPYQALLAAWTLLDERAAAAGRAEAAALAAEGDATRARTRAASRLRQLDDLAERHALPIDAAGLAARREELRSVDARLVGHADAAEPLRARLERWSQDWERWQTDDRHAEQSHVAAMAEREAAQTFAVQRDTVRATVGAGVEELQQRLARTRSELHAASAAVQRLQSHVGALQERLGAARQALAHAQERLAEHEPVVVEAAHAMAGIADVPGLVPSALQQPAHDEMAGFRLAGGVSLGQRVPTAVSGLARRLAALPADHRPTDSAAVYATWQDVSSSDAADHDPRVVPYGGDVLSALGRDDGGEHPVGVLAERLAVAVARDRELLSDRERTLFEEHLLGDLGEMLRQRRLEAAELVEAMNRLLGGVTTSQGITVQLRWRLREDVPEPARRAIALLGQPVGALLPGERAELRDALHRLIDAARAEDPEDSYTEHLGRALDYRRWFAFRIRYNRPEQAQWQDLHRRSPLSQGEQKVVCYLPLFAAAAAHFTSLAGAAPHAPRFILLDDAFPKIDVRTHPLLFGLLVSLDLDFVVTSERLWGDHATVPSLAIYEALRDPAERGIAQYHYVWDGARLQAVGT